MTQSHQNKPATWKPASSFVSSNRLGRVGVVIRFPCEPLVFLKTPEVLFLWFLTSPSQSCLWLPLAGPGSPVQGCFVARAFGVLFARLLFLSAEKASGDFIAQNKKQQQKELYFVEWPCQKKIKIKATSFSQRVSFNQPLWSKNMEQKPNPRLSHKCLHITPCLTTKSCFHGKSAVFVVKVLLWQFMVISLMVIHTQASQCSR